MVESGIIGFRIVESRIAESGIIIGSRIIGSRIVESRIIELSRIIIDESRIIVGCAAESGDGVSSTSPPALRVVIASEAAQRPRARASASSLLAPSFCCAHWTALRVARLS